MHWCSELNDVPEDVLEYLEFLVAFSEDVNAAFKIIDGAGGNVQINIREFEDGVKMMRCRKFRGDHEAERIQAVFLLLLDVVAASLIDRVSKMFAARRWLCLARSYVKCSCSGWMKGKNVVWSNVFV